MVSLPILRQTIVLSGLVFCSMSNGYIFGQMPGMLNALYSRKDGIVLSDEEISWIASAINITSVCGFALAAIISEKIGRKHTIIFFNIPIIVNWIILYYAKGMILFMTSRILVGVCFGGAFSMFLISTAEYTSPKIRGMFLTLTNSIAPAIGTTLGHIFGNLYHWRTVALMGIVPTALSAILLLLSEESPSWLASKGKFEECDKAFRRLHGHYAGAETELLVLKEIEKCKKQSAKDTESTGYIFKKYITAWKKKYFWKLLLLSSMINVYLAVAGKVLYNTLAITILKNVTGSKEVLFFTLFVDGFVILGASLSCFLVKSMNMRTILFPTGVTANIFLLILSVSMYLHPEKGGYYAWVNCVIFALYFIVVNIGPYPILGAFVAEMFPLELKAYCLFISGIVLSTSMFLSVKLADYLFTTLGYHGTFLLNTSIMSACLGYVWFNMPETRGRTLQEIELYFKNNTFDEVEKVLSGEEVKVM